jgi:hypothetical protein
MTHDHPTDEDTPPGRPEGKRRDSSTKITRRASRPAGVPAADAPRIAVLSGLAGPAAPGDELRKSFVELEYGYLTQSSFHSDGLRNQIIQFYLIIAGAAGTILLGLAQLRGGAAPSREEAWLFSAIAAFIGLVGLVMLPIFVRLRRVVLECLQGTVLLKLYALRALEEEGDRRFASALLWDYRSLPTDESFSTASFLLIFVVMLLDSGMFSIAAFLPLSARLPGLAAALWSLAAGLAALTLQVALYRVLFWREVRRAMASDRLREKWRDLVGEGEPEAAGPALAQPLLKALVVGGLLTAGVALLAWSQAPLWVIR